MNRKSALTAELLKSIPADRRPELHSAMVAWWYNLRTDGGYRLTNEGLSVVCDSAEVESYIYDLKDSENLSNKQLLDLDRKLQCPYYLVVKKNQVVRIVFFDSKEYMTARLYNNLEQFLKYYNQWLNIVWNL